MRTSTQEKFPRRDMQWCFMTVYKIDPDAPVIAIYVEIEGEIIASLKFVWTFKKVF